MLSISLSTAFRGLYRLCQCNCGTLIKLVGTDYQIRRFVNGHGIKGERNGWWKGGRPISHDYILILKPDHPFCNSMGYVLEHRLVMEQFIGRYLTKYEEIHHINKNTKDNRIQNLKLISKGEHTTIHNLKDMYNRRCSICGSDKTRMRKTTIGLRPNWCGNEINGWKCTTCHDRIRNKLRKR